MADGNFIQNSLAQLWEYLAANPAFQYQGNRAAAAPGLTTDYPVANVGYEGSRGVTGDWQGGTELPKMTITGEPAIQGLGAGSYPGRSAEAEINRIGGPNY